MSRPASDMDQKMLRAGVELLTEGGFDAVDVRAVCRRAKANPGLFHYYFRTKRAFMDRAMALSYEVFFESLAGAIASREGPKERLEEALVCLGLLAFRHRTLVGSLTRDAKGEKGPAGTGVAGQLVRFSALFEGLVTDCAPAKGLERAFVHLVLVESAIGAPLIWSALDGILTPLGRPSRLNKASLEKNAFCEEAIRRRVRLAMETLLG